MKNLKDYLNETEDIKYDSQINEDAMTFAIGVLAFPSIVALLAWGNSLFLYGYSSFLINVTNKIIKMWRSINRKFRNIGKDDLEEAIERMKNDPAVKQQIAKTEKAKKLYEEELKEVYEAISNKDFDKARIELSKVSDKISENPDVHKVVITEIVKSLKQPPIYIQSPGNSTYQAIKKVLNIKIARASAEATKSGLADKLSSENEEDKTEE
jgi:hypothetical protein